MESVSLSEIGSVVKSTRTGVNYTIEPSLWDGFNYNLDDIIYIRSERYDDFLGKIVSIDRDKTEIHLKRIYNYITKQNKQILIEEGSRIFRVSHIERYHQNSYKKDLFLFTLLFIMLFFMASLIIYVLSAFM